MTPGYSHVHQTVSELGEIGSPGRAAFSVLLCLVAVSLLIYAGAIARSLRELGQSTLPAYFVGAMAISCAGVGVFAFPHPLHNIFGLSETIGLQAPLLAALVSRNDARTRQVTDVFGRDVRLGPGGHCDQSHTRAAPCRSLGGHQTLFWHRATLSFRLVVYLVRRVRDSIDAGVSLAPRLGSIEPRGIQATSSKVEVKHGSRYSHRMATAPALHPQKELSVGQVARRSGVSVSTVHFYQAEGLIHGWRSAGNQRRFPRGVLRRIAFIRVAQRAGIPLKEIHAVLCHPHAKPSPYSKRLAATVFSLAG